MNDLVRYLEGAKAKVGIKTNNEMARRIGLTSPGFFAIMQGRVVPSDDTCIKIAEVAGDDAERVLLLARKARAPESSKPYWDSILRKVAASSLVILFVLVVAPLVFPSPAQGADFTVYILCQVFGLLLAVVLLRRGRRPGPVAHYLGHPAHQWWQVAGILLGTAMLPNNRFIGIRVRF